MKKYEYLPLADRERRLLELHPSGSADSDLLSGNIRHVVEAEAPPYEALSYAWGSNEQSVKLCIRDASYRPSKSVWHLPSLSGSLWTTTSTHGLESSDHPTTFISITPNLESALRRLRNKNSTRLLWVDQLCINQEDSVERSGQVRLMGSIYQQAARTIVWIGEEDEHVSPALYMSSKLAAAMRAYGATELAERKSATSSRGQGPLGAFLETLGADTDFTSANWKSFSKFYNRPWFGRLWIIQEVAFSRQVILLCGSRTTTMPWATIDQNIMSATAEYHQLLPYPIGFLNCFTIATIRDRIWMRSADSGSLAASLGLSPDDLPADKDFDPIDIIAYTKTFECVEPRDRFFALYGLLKIMFDWAEEPDYSMTKLDVYRIMTRMLIHRDGSLRVLSGQLFQTGDSSWPSWVPDWSARDSLDRCCNPFHTQSSTFSTSGAVPVPIGQILSIGTAALTEYDILIGYPECLLVRGKHFDTCSTILDVWEWDQRSFPHYNPTLAQWIDHLTSDSNTHDSSWFRTFTADGFGVNKTDQSNVEKRRKVYDEWRRRITTKNTPYGQLPGHSASQVDKKDHMSLNLQQHAQAYDFAARSACRGRRLIVTHQGYVGLGPRNTQKGDLVCVLRGAKAPFVLRPVEGYFLMVGECYIDGIMYGESLKLPSVETEFTWFTLK